MSIKDAIPVMELAAEHVGRTSPSLSSGDNCIALVFAFAAFARSSGFTKAQAAHIAQRAVEDVWSDPKVGSA